MAKKGPVIHNHIENLNLEIDYDKLAKAIVHEKKEAEKAKRKHMRIRTFLMGMCNGLVYMGLAYFVISSIVRMWFDYAQQNEPSLTFCIVVTTFGAALTILLFISQQETCYDSDDEVLNHFNSNIGLVALIISLVALLMR